MALRYKLSICGFITVILTAVIPLLITFQHQKESIEVHLQEKLKAIAASSSQFIDGDLHNIILKTDNPDEFAQDEFEEIRSILLKLKKQNQLESDIYTMRPYDDESLEFVVMSDKDTNGNFYTGNLYKKEVFHNDVLAGKIASSAVYTDSEGTWISAAAPIIDSKNNVIGLLQADYEISHYYKELNSHIFKLSKIVIIAVILSFLLFLLVISRISRPLNQLTDVTIEISKGNWQQDINVKGKDEIGTLASNFIIMKKAILDQQDLLKKREEDALKAKDEAEEASKAKSEFLAVMSHEIRTPMNGVIASAELLNETPLDEKQKEYLYTLRQSADLQLRVINDILDFSKLDSNNMTLEDVTFDLHKLIINISEIQKISAKKQGLELNCKIDPNVPSYIQADPIRIRQMMLNISNNALKFTHQGSINFRVSLDKDILKIIISDTGIGVPKEKLRSIFDPFSQADNSTSRKYGGTGLGLSICKNITTLMNGDIHMTSEEGEGTSVTISFPITSSRKSSLHETQFNMIIPIPGFDDIEEKSAYKVLLVEDNILNQKVAIELLKPYNVEVIMAENGVQALEKVKSEKVNLVLMDCMMPVMDGYEATKVMRNEKLISDSIPIIALTANSSDNDIESCRQAGMDDFIAKPATRKKFQSIMDKWLPNTNLHKEEITSKESQIILLVEDNKVNLNVAEKLLAKYSSNILIAENGQEALDILKTNHVDVIFMDCMMPIMDGYEASKQIRAQKLVDKNTPIIALTANTSLEDRLRCKDSGMIDIIAKPATRNKLDSAFDKWVYNLPNKSTNKRVLLVDDNDINQVITAKLLEKYSKNIKFANDGFDAIKKIKEESFDLILMDCMMPNMNGYEATIEIRSSSLVPDSVPIIAITANSSEDDIEKCKKAGMDDLISKPITRSSLDDSLAKWFKA